MSGVPRNVAATASSTGWLRSLGWSLPAVFDYVTFMKVERSAYLGIRFDLLFSVYLVFALAMIIRHAWIARRAITRGSTAAGRIP